MSDSSDKRRHPDGVEPRLESGTYESDAPRDQRPGGDGGGEPGLESGTYESDAPRDQRPGGDGGVEPGLESGTYESDAGSGHVWVRRDANHETVRARLEGYPPGFVLEPGDETGLEAVDGQWRTVPSVVHTVRLHTRVEWWMRNRRTGRLRLLAERGLA